MAKVELLYRVLVHDKNGKLVKKGKWRKSKSFVIAFLQHIEVFFTPPQWGGPTTGPTIPIIDTANVSQSVRSAAQDSYTMFVVFAPDDDDSYGIVVGTGITAPTNSDYALETQIAHGVGSGQLDYGTHSRTTTGVVTTNVDFVITRTFYNGSGATVTVNEIGVYCSTGDFVGTQCFFCIIRDLLAAGVDVLDTQTLTVQYTLRTTV